MLEFLRGLGRCNPRRTSESRTKNHKPKFKSHPRLARTLHTSTCPLHTPLVQNGTVTLRPLSAAPHCGQSMWRTSISFRAGRSNCRRNPVGHGGIEMFLQSPRLRGHGRTWTHRIAWTYMRTRNPIFILRQLSA